LRAWAITAWAVLAGRAGGVTVGVEGDVGIGVEALRAVDQAIAAHRLSITRAMTALPVNEMRRAIEAPAAGVGVDWKALATLQKVSQSPLSCAALPLGTAAVCSALAVPGLGPA
jgi:hypothetical protein